MTEGSVSGRNRLRTLARRAMLARGLLPDFSPRALAEANAVTAAATAPSASLRDLRELLWASIDNDDSRDLDQLSVAEPATGGAVKILVAIADVDAAVKRGSALDEHAQANTTSVYTAAETFPMLPERLSTDLTSLGDGQERLAMVVDMLVTPEGTVAESEIYRAVVRNHAKLAYDSVAAWLDGTAGPPPRLEAVKGLDEQLRIQDRVAQAMKAVRKQSGSLTLETVETRAVFEGDALSELRPDEKNRAKELIEDFMLSANGVVARYLDKKGVPSLRRVLRSPERWGRIVDLARGLGERLPPEPSAPRLAEFLLRRREADPPRFGDLSLSVIKLLGRGEYALEIPGEAIPGHFGLAVAKYTHSTAPNRRFPDVVEQRVLKAALSNADRPYAVDELRALAEHCTEQEANADRVERQVRKSAAAMLLESRIGEQFDGVVTGASEKGTWVRIVHPPVEGKVERGSKGLDVGDRVKVELLRTDVERGYIDFARARGS
ncbi:MAG: RNB domain-containing ribonuclease [Polyangiaceae bacterium]